MSDDTSFYREQQNNIREHVARIDCSMARYTSSLPRRASHPAAIHFRGS